MLKHLATFGLLEHTLYYGARLTASGERDCAGNSAASSASLSCSCMSGSATAGTRCITKRIFWNTISAKCMEERLASTARRPHASTRTANRFPRGTGQIAARRGASLAEAEPGAALIVLRVADRDPAALQYLQNIGIALGRCNRRAGKTALQWPADAGPERSKMHVIGRELAGHVFVEERG